MHYAAIKKSDIANGEGVRTTLFVSGCRNRCEGCFQPETWDFNYGETFTEGVAEEIFDTFKNPVIRGLTVLGGEPMEPENQEGLLPLLREFKARFPERDVWLYTGNTYEELTGKHPKHTKHTDELLSYVDILVDGRFEKSEARLGLRFRGSANQRIIDMNKTRKEGKIVIWDGVALDKKYDNGGSK